MNRRVRKYWAVEMWLWRLQLHAALLALFLSLMPGVVLAQNKSSCDFSGVWYNQVHPGDGFIIYETVSGWLIYFLGYDNWGVPFWATSGLIQPGELEPNETYAFPLVWGHYVDGTLFEQPAPPSELEPWGTLVFRFENCDRVVFGLDAIDQWNFGTKNSRFTKLTSGKVASTSACDYSGVWYNPDLPGEGFNVFDTPSGLLVYYLGYDNFGTTIWAVSDYWPAASQSNQRFALPMSMGPYGSGGYFLSPLPPNALESWGTLTASFRSCSEGDVTLTTLNQADFGFKVTHVVKLLSPK